MATQELFQHLRAMSEQLGARTIYGEPVTVGDVTVVPVAKVAYGFGGGTGKGNQGEASHHGEGAGGGGGFVGRPAGYIEITASGTRFVAIGERRKIGIALLAGIAIGMAVGKARQRATASNQGAKG